MKGRRSRERLVEPRQERTFSQRIEDRARHLSDRVERQGEDASALSVLERELRLTLEHIDRVREIHENLRRNLLRQECYLDTEIMQRSPRPPYYIDDRLKERDRLRDRLRLIESERRRLTLVEEEQLRPLREQLLTLLNRHRQLKR